MHYHQCGDNEHRNLYLVHLTK